MPRTLIIADGFLWERHDQGLPGLPIEANVASVAGSCATVLAWGTASREGTLAITRWLSRYLPDAELNLGYSFPIFDELRGPWETSDR